MKNLAALRKQKGISQAELGAAIGVARSTICQYEKGNRNPDRETLIKIADYFGVPIDYLLRLDLDEKIPDEYFFSPEEQELLDLFMTVPDDKKWDIVKTMRREIKKMELKQLLDVIMQLSNDEVDELSEFIDYIVSKRK